MEPNWSFFNFIELKNEKTFVNSVYFLINTGTHAVLYFYINNLYNTLLIRNQKPKVYRLILYGIHISLIKIKLLMNYIQVIDEFGNSFLHIIPISKLFRYKLIVNVMKLKHLFVFYMRPAQCCIILNNNRSIISTNYIYAVNSGQVSEYYNYAFE